MSKAHIAELESTFSQEADVARSNTPFLSGDREETTRSGHFQVRFQYLLVDPGLLLDSASL